MNSITVVIIRTTFLNATRVKRYLSTNFARPLMIALSTNHPWLGLGLK